MNRPKSAYCKTKLTLWVATVSHAVGFLAAALLPHLVSHTPFLELFPGHLRSHWHAWQVSLHMHMLLHMLLHVLLPCTGCTGGVCEGNILA